MIILECTQEHCETDITIENEWDFENVTCPKCKKEYSLAFDEYGWTDEDGNHDESYYFYLEVLEYE